jgi:hypothetical protein
MLSLRKGRLALALPLLLAVVQISAEPPTVPAPEDVKVSVVAILAHNRDKTIDPRLKCIAEEVSKGAPFTGFQMGKMTCMDVRVGVREKFELVDDEVAFLTVDRASKKDKLIQIKLTPPRMGDVTYETTCGGFFMIITKYRTKKDETLIVAVRVRPCQK